MSREGTIASAKAQMLLELLQRKRVRLKFATAHQYPKKSNTTYQHPQILSITFHHHPLQLTRGACFNKYTHYENQTRKNIFLSEYSILQKQILLICKVSPKMESYAIGNYIKTIENIIPYLTESYRLLIKIRFSPTSAGSWSPALWLWIFLSSTFIKLKLSTFSKIWLIFSKLLCRLIRLS